MLGSCARAEWSEMAGCLESLRLTESLKTSQLYEHLPRASHNISPHQNIIANYQPRFKTPVAAQTLKRMVNATYSVYMRHGRRAQMDRWACQRAEIQAHATQAVESVANVVKETTILQKSSLLELPDELLLQIAGYLRPTQRLSSADGFPDIPPRELSPGLFEPKAERIGLGLRGFLSLTLTCKRLAPVAGEVLYCDVSLPQLPSESSPHCSRLISFLRTIIKHPEMASRVSHLAVWVQKGRVLRAPNGGLCKCAT
ncbi:hypothetical protein HBI56_195380 [Parastagonospora nodorum]|uniref:Uncharacterized protein n=2 Tax=Phaeosphaeria nodorum (strain SN15 / ATCC MYA-4574 / FGSC 10173) TaxID=321614 RepID=A0A7U2EXF2_PHANO|nr:hypothetical protein SNOG_14821 [Parastagonospora nodorum SN15]KAH3906345.1 hypothetical protein HBH56_207070 [Parastagonospora nodorum]EAT77673.1 hypothetical protein SNOG_14821 [Parastagonospora nodorum SN15]KAH3923819.1 hypothetical protein HBH54_205940 [Parastagonospora nodorum]KAH3942296.1 hypothetical protein HBH53_188440 [Parastagonospora nodorum]KAH3967262.1 hypothetical protein HBH52_190500 [Parastagonospora nodorum]